VRPSHLREARAGGQCRLHGSPIPAEDVKSARGWRCP